MKKLLYIFIITILFILPITGWLYFFWDIKNFSTLLYVSKLKDIYSQDLELKILTIINGSLYLISLIKVLTIKSKKNIKPIVKPASITQEKVVNNTANDWSKLYDNKQKISPVKQEDTIIEKKEVIMPESNIETTKKAEVKIETPKIEIKPVEVYKKEIAEQIEKIGYTMLSGCRVNGTTLDFMAVADNDTLVIGIINNICEKINANETTSIKNMTPSWFSIDEKFDSPAVKLKQARADIEKLITEVLPKDTIINIYPVAVFPNADIVNYNDLKPVWEQDRINIVRVFSNSVIPAVIDVIPNKIDKTLLPSYKNFVLTLIKYFQKK